MIDLFNFTSLPLASIEISASLLIVIGVLIFLIGLFGYCGARRESRTCLILVRIRRGQMQTTIEHSLCLVYGFGCQCSADGTSVVHVGGSVVRSGTKPIERASDDTTEDLQSFVSG